MKYFLLSVILMISSRGAVGNNVAVADSRIINGQPIPIARANYQVAIMLNINGRESLHCGGTLIKSDLVLTAAECLLPSSIQSAIRIYVGHENYLALNVTSEPERFVIHSGYVVGANNYTNNIALIKLKTPFPLGTSIGTINYTTSNIALGTSCTITGWGLTHRNNTQISENLMAGNVIIRNKTLCMTEFESFSVSWNTMLCAGSNSTAQDICRGDEGGPMVCNNVLVGISSFSKCGANVTLSLSGYTDISAYDQWIKDNGSGKMGINYFLITLTILLFFINF